MVDTVTQTPEVAPVTTTPAPAPAPAPVQTSTQAPVEAVVAPAQADPVAPIASETAPAVLPEPVETAPEKSILSEALEPKEETKPAETAEAVEAPKDEGGQSENTAPPPKYDPFTLPEGLSLDEARVGEFTNLLAELETSGKATHEAVQAFGQKAVDFHISEVNKALESQQKQLIQSWDKQKLDWRKSSQEEFGNRFQTTIDSALTFIRTHGGTPEQQLEFQTLMDTSGLGNHPAVIRMLANAGSAMSEGKPLAAVKPVPQKQSKTQTLYGSKS